MSESYPHDLRPSGPPARHTGELVNVAMPICAVELAHPSRAVIEEQTIVVVASKTAGNNQRPACSISGVGELVDGSVPIRTVELGSSIRTIVEEQAREVTSRHKVTRNNVRPAFRPGGAGELMNAPLPIRAIELSQSARTIVEE